MDARLEALLTGEPPVLLGQWWPCMLVITCTKVPLQVSSWADTQQLADEVHGRWNICNFSIFVPAAREKKTFLTADIHAAATPVPELH